MNQKVVNARPAAAQKNAVKQKGYTIIELSIGLAIVAIILVSALTGVTKILQSNNVNNDLKQLNAVASRITVLLSNSSNTSAITAETLVNLRVFDGMKVDTSAASRGPQITNSFGGAVTIAPNGVDLSGVLKNKGLVLISTNIPAAVCGEYITGLAPLTSHLSAQATVTAPTGGGNPLTTVLKSNTVTLTPTLLATVCKTGSTPTHVAILLGGS